MLYLACNDKKAFFLILQTIEGINVCQCMWRQIVGVPMGTNFAPLAAD